MQSDEPQLKHPQGYIAEKFTILSSALAAALRSLGLSVRTVDDSHPVESATSPSSTYSLPPSPKHPILQDLGAKVDKALQDAATAEPEMRHALLDAMEDDRVARNNPIHSQLLR